VPPALADAHAPTRDPARWPTIHGLRSSSCMLGLRDSRPTEAIQLADREYLPIITVERPVVAGGVQCLQRGVTNRLRLHHQ
jgi:hypothetical protein